MVLWAMAGSVAAKRPLASCVIAAVRKAPGVVVEASRQWSVAVSAVAADSSVRRPSMRTTSPLRGTAGAWLTSWMTGARLEERRELAEFGEPPAAVESPQFWPLLTARR